MISIMPAIVKTISTTQHNLLLTFFSTKVHCFGLEDELGQDIEAVVEEEEEIDFLCLWQVRTFYNKCYITLVLVFVCSFCLSSCLRLCLYREVQPQYLDVYKIHLEPEF